MSDPHEVIETMERVAGVQATPANDHRQAFRDRLHRAAQVADVEHVAAEGRFRRIKARVLGSVLPALRRQSDFNRGLVATLGSADQHTDRLEARLDALEDNATRTWQAIAALDADDAADPVKATLASHDVLIEELHDELARLTAVVSAAEERIGSRETESTTLHSWLASLDDALRAMERRNEQVRGDLAETRARLDVTLRALREGAGAPVTRTLAQVTATRASEFYATFEERFRGSRAAVRETLRAYDDDLGRLAEHGPVLDIGPGRGEWLELLGEKGITAYGVDTNLTFVEEGAAMGLDIRHDDALEHLSSLPPSSLGAVTAFHIAEHLDVDTLLDVLERAIIALRPGGMVLIETPNPTNLIVGASTFYLDPTHLRPLHPDLLRFAVERAGFVDVEVRYLNPGFAPAGGPPPELPADPVERDLVGWVNWALRGPLDYAVLATKPGTSREA